MIAIIPARKGSKRIPGKNKKPFNGIPAITRTIEKLLEIDNIDQVIVSTDDIEILEIVDKFETVHSIHRKSELCDDFTTTKQVIQDAIQKIENKFNFESVICVYPVTPLLSKERINEALSIFDKTRDGFLISAIPFESKIERAFRISNGLVTNFDFSNMQSRTQDLLDYFHDAGQFYIANKSTWMSETQLISNKSSVQLFEKYEVLDIDDIYDWDFAEKLFQIRSATENQESRH